LEARLSKHGRIEDPFGFSQRPGDGLPWWVNMAVTPFCNLNCRMCRSKQEGDLPAPTDLMLGFIEQLALWLPKGRRIIFTGGEPLTHPHILYFVERAANGGLTPAITTNGTLLTEELLDQLAEAGLKRIAISLDGFAEVHDELRNCPGTFDKAMDALDLMKKHPEIETTITSIISAVNAAELPGLVQVTAAHSAVRGHRFQAIVPTLGLPWSEDFYEKSKLWPRTWEEKAVVSETLDHLASMKDEGAPILTQDFQFKLWHRYFDKPLSVFEDRACHVADGLLQVLPDGRVSFCEYIGVLGTITDDPKEIWESARRKATREEGLACARACNHVINCCHLDPTTEP
jgi:MoaA/NifB/PqqE/SkfB family radical SAM enzyme